MNLGEIITIKRFLGDPLGKSAIMAWFENERLYNLKLATNSLLSKPPDVDEARRASAAYQEWDTAMASLVKFIEAQQRYVEK